MAVARVEREIYGKNVNLRLDIHHLVTVFGIANYGRQ